MWWLSARRVWAVLGLCSTNYATVLEPYRGTSEVVETRGVAGVETRVVEMWSGVVVVTSKPQLKPSLLALLSLPHHQHKHSRRRSSGRMLIGVSMDSSSRVAALVALVALVYLAGCGEENNQH